MRDIPLMTWRWLVHVLKRTVTEWIDDRVPQMGAALAFYTVFSIAPLLVIVISVAGLIFGEDEARQAMTREIELTAGPEVAEAVANLLGSATTPRGYTIATVIGVGLLFFGASGVFVQLQDSLNTIWKVVPKPGRGYFGIVRDRVLSFAVLLGTVFLLLVSLALSASLSALTHYFSAESAHGVWYWTVVNELVSLGIVTLLFALLYKVLPDAKIAWRHVWIGAATTAVLFTIGKSLIGFYLGRSDATSGFGAAGSLVVILLWVYYSAQIVLFGAEFTQVLATNASAPAPAP